MDDNILRKLLGRFKFPDLRQALEEWNCVALDEELFVGGGQKKAVVDRLVRACQLQGEEIGLEELGTLDLVYNKMYSRSRIWSAYHFTGYKKKLDDCTVSAEVFQRALGKQLFFYFRHVLCVRQYKDALWVWLMVQDKSSTVWTPSNIVHMVYYPASPYIFTSTMKAEYKEYILQALLLTIGYSKAQFMDLSGRDVESVAELAKRRHNQQHVSPESQRSRKRRKQDEESENEDVIQEDAEDRQWREDYTRETFGDEPQPTLENVVYKLHASFKHGGVAPSMDDQPFQMTVKFSGRNVLEGMKAMGPAGIAEPPLPSYLESIPNIGKNFILLAEKRKPGDGDGKE
ncbi:PREDICTED: centromere protein N-A-like [Branchiostoma belcheri]|uniref:Centromere protein N-A-like n=1 Tax=Branchiostoma belcheri TaxID=7741 RepID=A0A6P4YJB4_BRABE|nr:PREDICTED: centromere protein N-A-like [Branchiostoma belcheri]